MPRLIRDASKPYMIRDRIEKIEDKNRRKEIFNALGANFDHNRRHHILKDRTDDLTLTEALLISKIIGCTPAQLADNSFDFNSLDHG